MYVAKFCILYICTCTKLCVVLSVQCKINSSCKYGLTSHVRISKLNDFISRLID